MGSGERMKHICYNGLSSLMPYKRKGTLISLMRMIGLIFLRLFLLRTTRDAQKDGIGFKKEESKLLGHREKMIY